MGSIEIKLDKLSRKLPMFIGLAWLPYLLLAGLLVVSRVNVDIKAFFSKNRSLGWSNILGQTGVSGSIQFLYLPGGIMVLVLVLVLVVLATFLLQRMKFGELKAAVTESSMTLLGAGFVLVFTIPMVRILINSGVNMSDLPSMPRAMAELVVSSVANLYLFLLRLLGHWAPLLLAPTPSSI
jgi:lactate permease